MMARVRSGAHGRKRARAEDVSQPALTPRLLRDAVPVGPVFLELDHPAWMRL